MWPRCSTGTGAIMASRWWLARPWPGLPGTPALTASSYIGHNRHTATENVSTTRPGTSHSYIGRSPMRARDNGGSARVVHDQAKSQKVTLSWAAMRPDRRLGAGRDYAEGTADGTQIVPFGVPGDRASGLPGSACTCPRQRGLLGPVTSGCLAVPRWLRRAEKAEAVVLCDILVVLRVQDCQQNFVGRPRSTCQ